MNYLKIYKQLMERSKLSNRTKHDGIYYESHHIIPDFMFKDRKRKGPIGHLEGNPNNSRNLVLLTEREHILAHILLAKGLSGKRYGVQSASAVNWFFIKVCGSHPRQIHRIAGSMLKYERYRKLGIEGMSKARKGKMPCIDAITRESIGSISIDHPKVLSGEWIHHSKGIKKPQSGRNVQGVKNPRYREMTSEYLNRIFKCVKKSIVDDYYLSTNLFEINLKTEFSEFQISSVWVMNHLGSWGSIVERYNQSTGNSIIYKSRYKSKAQKQLLSFKNKGFRWVTNGIDSLQIKQDKLIEFLKSNLDFKLGKTQND